MDGRAVKKAVKAFAKENGLPRTEWKIFECSGAPAGQQLAFGLLTHGAYLGVVGFSPKRVEVSLSHLMAFDARAEGCWGCLPEHYPAVLDLVLTGKVKVKPFVERRPLSQINETFKALGAHAIRDRVVLIPDPA
jgi:6-hydroxycyclohex-1-ene-1-carbonyl-CoA dehydrogenase